MNTVENNIGASPRRINYWRLWLLDAGLVSGGLLFFLAMQYGTGEFFGTACFMGLLPFIPIMVLVGGGGSTVFALTKVMIEKRSLKKPAALALLVGPGLLVCALLVLAGAGRSPAHRLPFICAGHVPASVSHVRVAGYSAFLRGEWLAVFNVEQTNFQAMVASAKLVPADEFEFKKIFEQSSLKETKLALSVPPTHELPCFKRVFKPDEEHERGSLYAVFDPATSTAVVVRVYHD